VAYYPDTYFNIDRRPSATAHRTNSNKTSKIPCLGNLSVFPGPTQHIHPAHMRFLRKLMH